MRVIKTIEKLCLSCMEVHEVAIVEEKEHNIFKGMEVEYVARYEYCDRAEEYTSDGVMTAANDIAMKDAYRNNCGLLTSKEIFSMRSRFSISQKDLANLLGWGEKTITRYEGHQVQDMAHDAILRKISADPEWFLELLEKGKHRLSPAAYEKCKTAILREYAATEDLYLRKSIRAQYVNYQEKPEFSGNSSLNFEKIVAAVCYFANSAKVQSLYKVKLMKMLWYADFLAFKRYRKSITGMIYTALPMGAVPVAHKSIVELQGIKYEEVDFGSGSGYKFIRNNRADFDALSKEERKVLDAVIEVFGNMPTEQIVNRMHEETAYKSTKPGEIISYHYAEALSME